MKTSRVKTLHIVSVGPGNPKWLTLEAVEKLRSLDVIAVPSPRADGESLAHRIAEGFMSASAEILYLDLPMTYDVTVLENRWREAAEKILLKINEGKSAGMAVLGDASLFGTSAYIVQSMLEIDPAIHVEITPGVISPTACSSRLGSPLALGNQNVTIVPDSEIDANMEKAFAMGGTVVLMKISRSIQNVIRYLETRGLLSAARAVIKGGMPEEEIVEDITTLRGKNIPYMSLIIVKIPEGSAVEAPRKETPASVQSLAPISAMLPTEPGRGKLFLVGFGPGHREHMTFRARQAIMASDVVVGYVTYLKLVQELLDGKEIVRGGMTEEVGRAIAAYEKAKEGKIVSLISSGDSGVYGMAAPAFEYLIEKGWKPGDNPDVEVVPGVTAVNSISALLGAALSHDYASISLSDLLTPWDVIERRLVAAASSDMICGLYNPKSGRRTQQLVRAQEIFLEHRDPKTPVGIVKSAYRKRQIANITTLDSIQEFDIGMLTTLIIGNSSTIEYNGLMVTPRGYTRKYDLLSNTVHDGLVRAPVGGDWSLGRK